MNFRIPVALVALVLLGSCQTIQQPLRPGMTRTAVAASYSDLDLPNGDTKEVALNGSWGTFWESDQEVGLKVGYDNLEVPGSSTDAWTLALYGRYYLSTTDALLPWVELDLGWTDSDRDSNVSYAGAIGLTQFVSQGGALEAGIEYQNAFGDVDTSGIRLQIGYAVFF
ncbi:MAG: outer membrane beta-barrel protein [Planctomycetes bacterium]|nr:outer membrane beta-barrel protein [Planctomycetota bacterium]